MSDSHVNRKCCRPRFLQTALAAILPISCAFGEALAPVERTQASYWHDVLTNGPLPTGEATRTWTLATGAPLMSISENWNPIATPVAGDDVLFGTLKSGNYSVVQNLGAILGNFTVNRAVSTEVINLSGVINGSSFRVVKGVVASTATSFNVSAAGATNAASSIVAGDGVGNTGSLSISGATGKYYDARVGTNGSTGILNLIGTNTTMLPVSRFVTPSVFGGTADAANATILVDGATLEAWVFTTGIRGSMKFTNAAQVTSTPTPDGTGQVQIGSPDASNVSFEVSNNADLRVGGQDGTVLIGAGVGATTTTRVLSGGSIVADLFISGAESATGTATSTNTINVSGTGSTITTTEAFETNGSYRFTNVRRGNTNINLTSGGKLYTARYNSNAIDRVSNTGQTSTTTLLVDGVGSLLQAKTDVGGLFITSLGDWTTDTTTISNSGKIDAGQVALAAGIGSISNFNITTRGKLVAGLVELARPTKAGATNTANLVISDAGEMTIGNLVTSGSFSAVTNITVRDPVSSLDATGVGIFGGEAGEPLGAGNTTFQLIDGGNASFAALQASGASAVGAGTGYIGTQMTISGAGSQLTLNGQGTATPQPGDLAANLVLSANNSTKSSLTIIDGGALRIRDNSVNPNLDGSIAMSTATNTVSTLLIDGPDSSVDGGKIITMSEAPTANAFTNAISTITIRNGAFLGVYENESDAASGNLQMAIRPSTNSTATFNIGGGTFAEDVDTTVAIDGTLFVGGSGDATPIAGGRSTVNVNNGNLAAAAVAVYSNSKINLNGGHLATDNLLLLGGRLDMSAATPIAIELGALRLSNGGVLNVGKGGAVVYYSTANGSPSDIASIRQYIFNGSNGGAWNGTNGITSSLLSASTSRYAIGYADIDRAGINSLLDVAFVDATQAVVFRYTIRGDANLDGTVGFDDLLAFSQNYGAPFDSDWSDGDFNYSQRIDFDDLLLLSQNYGLTMLASGETTFDSATASRFASDWALARSIVPEPSTAALLGVAGLLIRRQRQV